MRTKPLAAVLTLIIASLAAPALAQDASGGAGSESGRDGSEMRPVTPEQARHWRVIEETVAGIAYCNRRDFLDPAHALPVLDWSGRHTDAEGRSLTSGYARAVREAVGRRRALGGEVPASDCARFDGEAGAATREAFVRAVEGLGIAAP